MSRNKIFLPLVAALGIVAGTLGFLQAPTAHAAVRPGALEIEIDLRNGSGLTVTLPLSGAYETQARVDWDVGNVTPTCVEASYPASGMDFLYNVEISCTYS